MAGFLFALPAILGMATLFLIPFCVTISISLHESVGKSRFVFLKNYQDVLISPAFRLAAWNTAKFILVAVPLIMLLALAIALMLSVNLRGVHLFKTFLIFPLVLPVVSVVLVFQLLFHDTGGLNSLLTSLGFSAVRWFGSGAEFAVLVMLYIWKNIGFNIILFLAALNSIPKDYYESAQLDGASGYRCLFSITLPLLSPYLFFILIISILNSFKSFREAFILFGDYPNQSVYMIQHFMNNNFNNLNYIRLSVSAVLIFTVIFLLIFFVFRWREKHGGLEL